MDYRNFCKEMLIGYNDPFRFDILFDIGKPLPKPKEFKMFKVTIEKIENKQTIKRGDTKPCKLYYTLEEFSQLDFSERQKCVQVESLDNRIYAREYYEYAPDYTVTEEITIKILEQTIEGLNLSEVIIAINNLPKG